MRTLVRLFSLSDMPVIAILTEALAALNML
jgi:hypothetical protein